MSALLLRKIPNVTSNFAFTAGVNIRLTVGLQFSRCSSGKLDNTVKKKASKFKDTVLLPKTEFPLWLDPRHRALHDADILEKCGFSTFYTWQRENLKGKEFVLHDGPPYANGSPHVGHAVNKILKDIIMRFELLNGHRIHYVPGWDCHGLPIELKAISAKSQEKPISPLEIRQKARNYAAEAIELQRKSFRSWGILGDWDSNCYFTYDAGYVKNQLQQFYSLFEKRFVYRDMKPIYWSPSSRTALAEAELQYNKHHKSTCVTVRVPLLTKPFNISISGTLYALIWTTTPWTLPANEAINYKSDMQYSIVQIEGLDGHYIVASKLVSELEQKLSKRIQEVQTILGRSLRRATYCHPIYKDQVHRFFHAEHVSDQKGTGLVHCAPSHGREDYIVAVENKLKLVSLVDKQGNYIETAGASLVGKNIMGDGAEAVQQILRTDIIHSEELEHSYPYDWRTNKPVFLLASEQWFFDCSAVRDKAVVWFLKTPVTKDQTIPLRALDTSHYMSKKKRNTDTFSKTWHDQSRPIPFICIPPFTKILQDIKYAPDLSHKKAMEKLVSERPFWCISRQRAWGVPIPVLFKRDSKDPIITKNLIKHYCDLIDKHGPDFWWILPNEDLCPLPLAAEMDLDTKDLERCHDILDIWFDSGLSWSAVLDGRIADIYLEGSDQLTGWFQSSILTSVAICGRAPYRKIFTHGFVVDEDGHKMSKSIGNVIDPNVICNGGKNINKEPAFGVDTLRWWVAAHSVQHANIPISANLVKLSYDTVQKLRGTIRYALGVLHGFPHELIHSFPNKKLSVLDKYILHASAELKSGVENHYSQHKYNFVCAEINNFVVNDVSALYFTLTKDRLFCDEADSDRRRACQYAIYHVLEILLQLLAPITPLMVEEAYYHHPVHLGRRFFEHRSKNPIKIQSEWNATFSDSCMKLALEAKEIISKISEGRSTKGYKAIVKCSLEDADILKPLFENQPENSSELSEILQVGSTTLVIANENEIASTQEKFHVELIPLETALCARCRRFEAVMDSEICGRCMDVLDLTLKSLKHSPL